MAANAEIEARPEVFRVGELIPIEEVRMDSYVVCAQMRPRMIWDKQQELKNNITAVNQLLEPILLARVDETTAREYVRYTNECWGKRKTIKPGQISADGSVLILAAGHRRDDAYAAIAKDNGHSRAETVIDAKIIDCKSKDDIIGIQVSENFHERPPALQYAMAVREMYFIGVKDGKYKAIADFLPHSPLTEKVTREALAYFSLPVDVQKIVEQGQLPYGIAVELCSLQRALIDRFLEQTIGLQESASIEQQAEAIELASLAADSEVKTKAMFLVGKMQASVADRASSNLTTADKRVKQATDKSRDQGEREREEPEVRKQSPWTARKAREHIRGVCRDLRTSQMEITAYVESAVDRATAALQRGVGERKRVISRSANEAIIAAHVLVEAGEKVPVSKKTLEIFKRISADAGEFSLAGNVVLVSEEQETLNI